MPHRAATLMAANGKTNDPSFIAENGTAINDASDLKTLMEALGYGGKDPQIAAAEAADGFLPAAIVNGLLGAYRAAVTSGTDVVHANWAKSSGFSISVAQEPGTDAVTDQGVISVTVRSPKLSGGG